MNWKKDVPIAIPTWGLPVYGVCMALLLLALSWCQPLFDGVHSFRQTQTAISAYWIAAGGSFLGYETPVAGYPWSIPFEFPLYQWIVAQLSGNGALPQLEHAGRVVGMLFFFGSAILIRQIALVQSRDARLGAICAGAFLASPLLLFWSRAFMIESCAVFFGLLFVLGLARHVQRPSMGWLAMAAIAAMLAALVKITTYFGFAVLVAAALGIRLVQARTGQDVRRAVKDLAVAAGIVLLSLLALKLWLWHADALKAKTPWGTSLSSASLGHWNYGSLAQRLSPGFWYGVVYQRALGDIAGAAWLVPILFAAALSIRKARVASVVLLLAYLAPFLVFTNLHQMHDYYQYANAAFVTTIMALAVWAASHWGRVGRYASVAMAIALCFASWARLSSHYLPLIQQDAHGQRTLKLAREIEQRVPSDRALIVFGLDWDSALPYYAKRKALMLPDWLPGEILVQARDPARALGSTPFGAWVACPNATAGDPARMAGYQALFARYATGAQRIRVDDCDVYVAPSDTSAGQAIHPYIDYPSCRRQETGDTQMQKIIPMRTLLACAFATTVVAGCDRDQALPESRGAPSAVAANQPAPAPIPDPTVDNVDEASLRDGLQAMQGRVVSTRDGFAKVEPKLKSRYFLHPGEDKPAMIQFDTTGLESLDLSPYIEDSAAQCAGMPDAGIVRLSWQVDARPAQSVVVDRKHHDRISVPLAGSKRLKLEADKGNGVIWCDWLSVGLLDVRKAQGD